MSLQTVKKSIGGTKNYLKFTITTTMPIAVAFGRMGPVSSHNDYTLRNTIEFSLDFIIESTHVRGSRAQMTANPFSAE